MKESVLSDHNTSTNLEVPVNQSIRTVTLDEAFELTYGNGRYQLLIFLAGFIGMASSMWYLYCIPFFLSFPKVLGCKNGICETEEEACNSTSRYYDNVNYNLITELDLLCKDIDLSIIPSSFPMGFLMGNIILSSAADIFGRLPVLLIGQFGMTFSILYFCFFPSYNTCIICTSLCGFFSVASFFPSYSLLYGANHSNRVKLCAAFLAVSAAVAGLMVVSLMRTKITWRLMCVIFMCFCSLFYIFPTVFNESPPFFYSKGQPKSAAKIFYDIAKMNKVELNQALEIKDTGRTATKGASCLDKMKLIFMKWILINLALCGISFFAAGFVYYGIVFNIEKFGGNLYDNVMINTVAEIIADVLAFAFGYKIGLKKTMILAFSIMTGGLVCQFLSKWTYEILDILGLFVAKFGVSAAFIMIYSWAGELFPTAILSTAIGFLGLCDRVGALLSPIPTKDTFSLIGIASGIAAIIIAFTITQKKDNS